MAERKTPRPTSVYRGEFAAQAAKLCALGATRPELADFFGVAERTVTRWQAAHPEFATALQAGRERADERVEQSLYRRAVGYTREVVKVYFPRGSDTPVLVPYEEQVPPDTRAALAWLKHRCPAVWSERRDSAKDAAAAPEKTVIILPPNGRD